MALEGFDAAVAGWFEREFDAPTQVQVQAWRAIRSGQATLISAPTGSGKTLAAFLGVIDELVKEGLAGRLADETRVLYVSPLKALSNDVQKNLQRPLDGIRRELAGSLLDDVPIRAWVRTGDTPQSERARMRRLPPHILVTTPESLYILLTSETGRRMLKTVKTVIVDEIHAIAASKRGAHLTLSLERLTALCGAPPTRVGISATTKPIERMARFLTGGSEAGPVDCRIIDEGHVRERDLALQLPESALEAIMSGEVWMEVYDRLAELISAHRTTLVFVNTRRMAERVARHLGERVGEHNVTSHHGSLAKEHRLSAEQRLKAGGLRALVATSSLELGIDIGDVDLVCQLGSPRAIAAFLQRVGRSGHGLGRLPKGRLFPLSRDELVESAALLDSVRRAELDAVPLCEKPLDVLAQQITAEVSMREWRVEELYACLRRAANFAALTEAEFAAVVRMLADGFATPRGRRGAHIHFDRVNGVLRGRRGARLTAITNGGAIPDQFDYDVVLLPQECSIGSLNEDFAFESLPGDIFQLGNTSYRILKVTGGKVYVEDAKGQPPNIPFWFGEAPGRSDELSASVSRLRGCVDAALEADTADAVAARLAAELALPAAAAEQLVEYLAAAKAALGCLPTAERIVFERFFDETGDMHLVIHSPLGSRLNRAWGLSLRKRFCRRFNFELQAAALEDSIVLSLGAVHSFALDDVARYLHSASVRGVLEQAVLGAPVFPTHWRWNATIALAVRRFRNGKRAPAQFQRTDAEDLLAVVFPAQLACAENLPGGDIELPAHPLVTQTLHDCLSEVMDIAGLERLLQRIESGTVRIECRDLAGPSPLAQEILGARPYAFLDDAPAEERRTLAVQARRYLSAEQAADLGRLDAAAIERVRDEAWPQARDPDELCDALNVLGFVTEAEGTGEADGGRYADWRAHFAALRADGRATTFVTPAGAKLWVGAERLGEIKAALPDGKDGGSAAVLDAAKIDRDTALRELCRSRLEALGPVTAGDLAQAMDLAADAVEPSLLALEQEGVVMRGVFSAHGAEEWCERRLLARIHRYTLKRLRSEIEPVGLPALQRFLFRWQGLGSERREGSEALAAVLTQLQGLVLPAAVWESDVLPARLAGFAPRMMDGLSESGAFVWWRPPRAAAEARRANTVAASGIGIVPRGRLPAWRRLANAAIVGDGPRVSSSAERVRAALAEHGALFFADLVQLTGLLRVQVEDALGELVARGLVSADRFNGLRLLLTPQRQRAAFHGRRRRARAASFDAAGRWALLERRHAAEPAERDAAVEHAAQALLGRYGVVARSVLARESLAPPWRELVRVYRRREARGEIRGGRFVAALGGEQFALPEAVEALRRARGEPAGEEWVVLSAADPLNMAGLFGDGKRVASVASHALAYRNGVPVAARGARGIEWLADLDAGTQRRAQALLRAGPRSAEPPARRAEGYVNAADAEAEPL